MRTLVRFYTSNIEPRSHRVHSAVIHHIDCPEWRHLNLAPGQRAAADNGWWERFRAWPEASDAAVAHGGGGAYVQHWSQCCRHLHNLERYPKQEADKETWGQAIVTALITVPIGFGILYGIFWFIDNNIDQIALFLGRALIWSWILLPVLVILLLFKNNK